jgi:UDP-3-O-[3-hydroxymyristoyl] glucosamine N-acyltransferase
MVNPKFYNKKDFVTIKRICELIGAPIPPDANPEQKIINIESVSKATATDITFFHNVKYADELPKTKAFACIITPKHQHQLPKATLAICVNEPYLANAILLKEFYSLKNPANGSFISPKASISNTAIIEDDCYISDFAVIADDVVIKKGTFIGSNTVIMYGVEIGRNSHIESNVTIGFATIGDAAYIKSGTRIGMPGFGFHASQTGITDVFHTGTVIVGNNVHIGSNCVIDRGSLSDTIIGNNTRIDNMIYISHNVKIGNGCIIAGLTGIAGSTTIGSACIVGGQVGIGGHLSIGGNVTIAAKSGVMRDIQPGCNVAGIPAVSALSWHRQTSTLQQLATKSHK